MAECEAKFGTTRTRKKEIVPCTIYPVRIWRHDKESIAVRVAHSWMQGVGTQEIHVTLTPKECIELAMDLLNKAADDLQRLAPSAGGKG